MAVWELIRDAVENAHREGKEWLTLGEVVREVQRHEPGTNRGSIAADTKFHCINDPSKKHSPGQRWRVNPLLITDAPTVRGKRYRLLTPAEREAFLTHFRDDLEPELTLYQGFVGKEFRTSDPPVGILDFLATDREGNFVVIETKRDLPDRRAIGQILSHLGWVSRKLCSEGQSVRGILITGDASDELQLAAQPVPGLSISTYEISFAIRPLT